MSIVPFATSDAAIAANAERRLRESPYFFLRQLTCVCRNGCLIVRGQAPFPQLRGFAEAIVSRVDGVREVVNEVEVVDPTQAPSGVRAARNAG